MRCLMFFSYANFQRLQKQHCYELHAFPGMVLKPFKKLAARVLLGIKPLGCASWFEIR